VIFIRKINLDTESLKNMRENEKLIQKFIIKFSCKFDNISRYLMALVAIDTTFLRQLMQF